MAIRSHWELVPLVNYMSDGAWGGIRYICTETRARGKGRGVYEETLAIVQQSNAWLNVKRREESDI